MRMICCGRDQGTWPPQGYESWSEADKLRSDYIDAEGHQRVGIIEAAEAYFGKQKEGE